MHPLVKVRQTCRLCESRNIVCSVPLAQVPIGSASLDMFDRVKQELVWRGVVSKSVDLKAKPEKRQKNMAKSAEKLFKKYPPVVKEKK